MSSKDEQKEQKEEKVESVDVENFDFTNDLFRKTYGSAAIDDAKARTERMVEDLNKTRPVGNHVNKTLKDASLSAFSKEVVYENFWTNSTLDLLERWVTSCKKSSEAHADAARACRKKFRMVSIPTIIIGTAATALSFFSAGDNSCDPDEEGNDGLKYSVAFLTSLVSIATGINALYNFSSMTQEHRSASGSFANLARRGELQTWLPNGLRANAEVVLTDISVEVASLTTSAPLLGAPLEMKDMQNKP